jgi:hypothetical protein
MKQEVGLMRVGAGGHNANRIARRDWLFGLDKHIPTSFASDSIKKTPNQSMNYQGAQANPQSTSATRAFRLNEPI